MMGRSWWLCRSGATLVVVLLLCCSAVEVISEGSASCLMAFKASLEDPGNSLATWSGSQTSDVCSWAYIVCRHPNGNDVHELNLAGLGLQGQLRLDLLSDCKSLEYIDLSYNRFSGNLPPAQLSDQIPNLVKLDLSSNALQGPIPSWTFLYLNILYLQSNRLSGAIPAELGLMPRLRSLNLSENRLEGFIPDSLLNHTFQGELSPYTDDSFLSNPGLWVPDAFCSMFRRIRCGQGGGKSVNRWVIAAIVPAAVLVVVALGSLIIWKQGLLRGSKPRKEESADIDPKSGKTESAKLIPFTAVSALESIGTEPVKVLSRKLGSRRGLVVLDLCTATANFNREHEIGSGGFSTVYKGTLRDGKLVAIKWINLDNRGEPDVILQHFVKEVESVSSFKHQNLVKTLGYVAKEEMMLLILEYMQEGSLEMQLYGPPAFENSETKRYKCQLTWDERYTIALGVAKALKYLHQDAPRTVVHSDLNPSNILLDSAMMAYISPFGIARLVSETAGSLASYWTVGYTAPEKVFSMKKSAKADVYSFGILLLELVTRQRPTSSLFGDGVTMSEWVKGALAKHSLLSILDPTLTSNWAFSASQVLEMTLVCKLGLACSQDASTARPDMKAVVDILQQRVKNKERLSSKLASVEEILGDMAV